SRNQWDDFCVKILIVVGARPNFMKAAPIINAVREFNSIRGEWSKKISVTLVHTGQHYDAQMSDAFFADLELPKPDVFLGAGSGSHAEQTAEIIKRFEPVFQETDPDVLVVVGDVNSTLACALVAAKITPRRPVIVHVEAGLRSNDRSMPEEINRILTDQISDLLFVTESSAIRNLQKEGIPPHKIVFAGNTMIDSLRSSEQRAETSDVLQRFGLESKSYALLTLHRAANVDERGAFVEILEGLGELRTLVPIIFPVHPRTQKQIRALGLEAYFSPGESSERRGIRMIPPQGYLDFLCLMKNARLVVTDSGGIQEETTALGVPCVTLRDNTERPVTVQVGTNILGGIKCSGIQQAIRLQLTPARKSKIPDLWDGRAAARIVGTLAELFLRNDAPRQTVESGQIQQNAR
ncbi:MAG TPA: UDP-N-acetylglucosamine 2-epimerase (non-hydrolyzing), partial [Candidatus Angelobacter sp.]|nr:UDP-N-acetylglucosamine 2-epimerase (non-hydrolyzing) [Candidatus Angelobacter sp.]